MTVARSAPRRPAPLAPLGGQSSAHRRRAFLLLAAVASVIAGPVAILVLVVVGLLAGMAVGVMVAVVAGAGVAALLAAKVWRRAEATVLEALGTTPADDVVHARFFNLVEGLSLAAGVPRPRLLVVDAAGANALSVGRDARRAAVVATTGLLDQLSRIELEGVLAHELCHLRSGDVVPATVASAAVQATWPGRLLAGFLVGRAVDARRELAADVGAARLTRYPPGLAAGLERLAEVGTAVPAAPASAAHLWFAAPGPGDDGLHRGLEERVEALREL